ncbi:Vacuolar protein sorting-associated protein 62 [Knufia obscura]|uniref:Vacuolar protein sorting-associated protein 62 n=2 Tax=Knufia TaxID=430999 RepID=A0AAN8EA46_9EURO|nr:Vacuolar protein sorting-associated protein 62 [Knufia obscura]KAK5950289.1 Vacuolar protein sorting-associated protein 62 [Knufia fluminis]
MKQPKTKATIGVLSTLIAYISVNSWLKTHKPDLFISSEYDRENTEWVATSKSWTDRKACRWLGICGGSHMHFSRHRIRPRPDYITTQNEATSESDWDWQSAWTESKDRPEDWTTDDRVLREIPEYIQEYAPLVHLFSGEQYWPCDLAEHLYHINPELNYTAIQSESEHPTLKNLDKYNEYQRARWVFLTSKDDPEEHPDWLGGQKNIPNTPSNPDDDFADNEGWVHHPGRTYMQGLKDALGDMKDWFGAGYSFKDDADLRESSTAAKAHAKALKDAQRDYHRELKRSEDSEPHRLRGGRSDAPAVLVAVNKGHGIVDAFWFFFYSFNLGNSVFNVRFGNHVGDWEHTAIRFHHGVPKAVFFSEHNFGSAYSYEAVEKIGKRPVVYSAVGTHAMYATPGGHPYVLPWGILHDQTDRGPLWDPALNSHAFTYDFKSDTIRASNITPHAPTEWFHFAGHWGDKYYPLGDKRQYRFAGQYHYVNGPLGPKFKNLGRKKICGGPDRQPCIIKHWLGGEAKTGRLQHQGEEADMYTAEAEQLGIQR